ncbi:MAG TPA: alpha/beta fold hydrolase [Candidatus Acidoferrum sp.]
MNMAKVRRAVAGILLLMLGAILTFVPSRRYTERRYVADTGACKVDLDVVALKSFRDGSEPGSVVLLHGLSSNKVIMNYMARVFAEQGLRVYVPDLPGHGRSPGPFTPEQAETCALSLLRGLAARGLLVPDRTVIAGHSMGGAIALRVAGKFRPAGVIAISPAPMKEAHGVTKENLLFRGVPPVPPNTLILTGQLEPGWLTENAAELVTKSGDGSVEYRRVPLNTHVSVLFSPTVAREAQAWTAKVLKLPVTNELPTRGGLVGGVLGLAGILLLAGPFIREATGKTEVEEKRAARAPGWTRAILEFAGISAGVVVLLRYGVPLKGMHAFEGDYLASFFLLVGMALLLVHGNLARAQFRTKGAALFGALLSGLLLYLLLAGWLQLTLAGAWPTLARWIRFPFYFMGAFLFLFMLEVLVGPVEEGRRAKRFGVWMGMVALAWLALAGGIVYLHSGEFLLALLGGYLAAVFLCVGLGARLVRRMTGSATAAAVFSAILLAGICQVIFPLS